jgi:hypothetical protein
MEKNMRSSSVGMVKRGKTVKKRYPNTGKTPEYNKKNRDVLRAALVGITAELTDRSPRFVNYVLSGTRKNEAVLTVYMELSEGSNLLMQAVKSLLPFEGPQDVELKMGYEKVA